jgi:hypothetical protein
MMPKTKPTTKVIPAIHHRSRRVWAGADCVGRPSGSLELVMVPPEVYRAAAV